MRHGALTLALVLAAGLLGCEQRGKSEVRAEPAPSGVGSPVVSPAAPAVRAGASASSAAPTSGKGRGSGGEKEEEREKERPPEQEEEKEEER